jgi:hypothetical protein
MPAHDQDRIQAHHQIRQQLQKLASTHSVAPGDIEKDGFRRSTSIDMLARVSVELQEQQPTSMEGASVPRHISTNSSTSLSLEGGDGFYFNAANNYNYKKLPPGVTPKNNRRLFVRHTYRDHSSEIPAIPEEMELMSHKAPLRTPNAAFPLKLHEILSLIESDGHDDIIGWLPHGRSFKIHKHKEFVETILPKYFVMVSFAHENRMLCLTAFLMPMFSIHMFTSDEKVLIFTTIKSLRFQPPKRHRFRPGQLLPRDVPSWNEVSQSAHATPKSQWERHPCRRKS